MKKQFLETGKITSTHGIKGEMRVEPWCDSPQFLCGIKKLYLDADGKKELNVLKMRVAGRMLIMKAEGIDSIEQAEAYRNKRIYLNRDDVNIGDGHFIEDLLGCEVFNIDSGEKIGEISDVSKTGANDVWHIKSDDKTYLIPVIDSVVINVDVDNGKIEIRPLEGLFDI